MKTELSLFARILGWLFYTFVFLSFLMLGLSFGIVGLLICSAIAGALVTVLRRATQYKLESTETPEELDALIKRITLLRVGGFVLVVTFFGWALLQDLKAKGMTFNLGLLFCIFGALFFGLGGLLLLVKSIQAPNFVLNRLASTGQSYSLNKVRFIAASSILAGCAFAISGFTIF